MVCLPLCMKGRRTLPTHPNIVRGSGQRTKSNMEKYRCIPQTLNTWRIPPIMLGSVEDRKHPGRVPYSQEVYSIQKRSNICAGNTNIVTNKTYYSLTEYSFTFPFLTHGPQELFVHPSIPFIHHSSVHHPSLHPFGYLVIYGVQQGIKLNTGHTKGMTGPGEGADDGAEGSKP